MQYHPLYNLYSNNEFSYLISSSLKEIIQIIKNGTVWSQRKFEERIQGCNWTQFESQDRPYKYSFDLMVISQLLIVIYTTIFCLLGITTNILVTLVVGKYYKIDLKEKHYVFMAINSVANIIVFLLQLFSLINEYQYPFGLFCSSIRKTPNAQYFKIYFLDPFESFFRLFSNFT